MCNPIPAPVAPEFILALQDNVEETVVACLRTMKAPPQLIDLVEQIRMLGIYLQECEAGTKRSPEIPFGIEEIAIKCVNLIAECGGVFHTSTDETAERKMPLPMRAIEAQEVLADKRLTWKIVDAYLKETGYLLIDQESSDLALASLYPQVARTAAEVKMKQHQKRIRAFADQIRAKWTPSMSKNEVARLLGFSQYGGACVADVDEVVIHLYASKRKGEQQNVSAI
jgi:hypothetical protein